MKKKHAQFLSLVLVGLVGLFSTARAIEGGDTKARYHYAQTLRSVLQIETFSDDLEHSASCSSTLISPYILLTAFHCTEYMKPGKAISVGFGVAETAEIVDVIRQGQKMTTSPDGSFHNTDLALVLFKSKKEKSILSDLPVFQSPSVSSETVLKDQVLIAGYGNKTIDEQYSGSPKGRLTVGYNRLATESERVGIQDRLQKIHWDPDDSLYLEGERDEKQIFKGVVGVTDVPYISTMYQAVPRALGLPGDSGGPLFALDENDHLIMMGVLSKAHPNFVTKDLRFFTRDDLGLELYSTTVDEKYFDPQFYKDVESAKKAYNFGMTFGLGLLDQWLKKNGYINTKNQVLKFSEKVFSHHRTGLSTYVPIHSELNQKFIQDSLKRLIDLRDHHEN